ncbi:MAG: extracellular solute-binding protein, partial [Candidatus Binatia bacterium]
MKFPFHVSLVLFSLSLLAQLHAQSQSTLVDGAKKEGKLTWYTSMAVDTSKPLLDAFVKEHPFIKPELVRLGEEQLVNRILSETRAGRWAFDVLSTSSISTMIERKMIAPYLAPDRDLFMDQFRDPQGYWTGVFVNNLVLAFNTKMLAAKDAPRSYEDLLQPKWKGQMLMDST